MRRRYLHSGRPVHLVAWCVCTLLLLATVAVIAGVGAVPAYAVLYDTGNGSNGQTQQGQSGSGAQYSEGVTSNLTTETVNGEDVVRLTIADLVNAEPFLDGATVKFSGEAIGEELVADKGHRWVNLEEGGELIGVYMTIDQAQKITNYGSYHDAGTVVTVIGKFNIACSDHAGELDVHASDVQVEQSGGSVSRVIRNWELYAGLGLLVIGNLLYFARRRLQYAEV